MTARIGVIDIETAPILAHVWGLYDQTVGLNQIDTEWTILSYCFKPLGAPKNRLEYVDNSKAADPRDDAALLPGLREILHEYDFLIAQNGKKFDMRKIRARLVLAGHRPPSPVRILDTMLMARQVGAFTSNKLEWLSDKLCATPKSKHREFPGFELWRECLAGNQKAWSAMRKYNIPDVLATEELYLKLRPWVEGHPNITTYTEDDTLACPRCGSHDMHLDGHAYSNVSKYHRYRCGSCGGWSRDRYTINSRSKRKALLAA